MGTLEIFFYSLMVTTRFIIVMKGLKNCFDNREKKEKHKDTTKNPVKVINFIFYFITLQKHNSLACLVRMCNSFLMTQLTWNSNKYQVSILIFCNLLKRQPFYLISHCTILHSLVQYNTSKYIYFVREGNWSQSKKKR